MTDDGGQLARWCRAGLLAVVAVQLGSFAHVTAGGLMPGARALAVLTAGTVLLCAAVLGARRSAWRVAGLLVVAQTVVHAALSLAAGHRGDPVAAVPAPAPVTGAGEGRLAPVAVPPDLALGADRRGATFQELAHADSPVAAVDGTLSLPAPVAHLVSDLSSHASMALAHLAAAVLVGAWLAWGEQALWRLLVRVVSGAPDAVRVLLARVAGLGLGTVAGTPLGVPRATDAATLLLHRATRLLSASHARARRGPPALLPA